MAFSRTGALTSFRIHSLISSINNFDWNRERLDFSLVLEQSSGLPFGGVRFAVFLTRSGARGVAIPAEARRIDC
jgi:hypothetical protein